MRIAVVGTGISGNLAARILSTRHEVDVYEAGDHVGGHAQTVEVFAHGHHVAADVAFMVLNRRTYPNFCRLLDLLGVETQDSDMSLSVRCCKSGLEYQGSSLNGLFAQRSNLLRVPHYHMLLDVLRFNAKGIAFCDSGDESTLLGEFLRDAGLGRTFRDNYLVPMSAAIWSADPACLDGFPAKFILQFFRNHGLLQLRDRPQWLTVAGRSRSYVRRLMEPLRQRTFLRLPVREVRRQGGGVQLCFEDRDPVHYEHVVLATHADQSLRLLGDADPIETEILRAFAYQPNHAILHTDQSVLPRRRRAWASWNYHLPASQTRHASVTYDLNRLQGLGLPGPLCLTLNPSIQIEPNTILREFEFQHPVFSAESSVAQRRFDEINARRSVSFCGAYWGYGFHEDGVNSALAVTAAFGLSMDAITDSDSDQSRTAPVQLAEA